MMDSELITFGPVHLEIRDPDRSVKFWRDIAGLALLDASDGVVSLGVDSAPLIVLHQSATRPVQPGYSGLYHLAIHLPNEPEFARVLARLSALGLRFGTTDHIIAKSIYLSDPDGIGLEIAFETPERVRSYRWDKGSAGPLVIDSEGRRRQGVETLDVAQVLAVLPTGDLMRPLPPGTSVGHLHLHVKNLETSYEFYRDKIGLIPNLYAPWSGYGDLGADGRVAHRIALNTWQGAGHPSRPAGVAGMLSFTMRFASPDLLRGAVDRIGSAQPRGREYVTQDPDGNALVMELGTRSPHSGEAQSPSPARS
jgi:catechol 2,3-dioxygenase